MFPLSPKEPRRERTRGGKRIGSSPFFPASPFTCRSDGLSQKWPRKQQELGKIAADPTTPGFNSCTRDGLRSSSPSPQRTVRNNYLLPESSPRPRYTQGCCLPFEFSTNDYEASASFCFVSLSVVFASTPEATSNKLLAVAAAKTEEAVDLICFILFMPVVALDNGFCC